MSLSDAASAVAPWLGLVAAVGTTVGTVLAFTSPNRVTARLRADIRSDIELLSTLDPSSGAAYDLNEVVSAEVTDLAHRVAYRRMGLLALNARLGGISVVVGVVYLGGALYLPNTNEIENRLSDNGALPSLIAIFGLLAILIGSLVLITAGFLAAFFWLHARLPEATDVFHGQLLQVKKDREQRRALVHRLREHEEKTKD